MNITSEVFQLYKNGKFT